MISEALSCKIVDCYFNFRKNLKLKIIASCGEIKLPGFVEFFSELECFFSLSKNDSGCNVGSCFKDSHLVMDGYNFHNI